jgi:glycerol-3-phosphate acyltransferase PlsY
MKILFAVCSYLLGAVPFGYLFFHASEKRDIRNFGSQSTGATNVLRLKGWGYALPVAFLDVLKGFIPPFAALKLFQSYDLALLGAFLAIVGHCFPVYLKFRGGKGVAATVGAFAVLGLKPLLLSLVLFALVILFTRYVSLGSILAAFSYPLLTILFKAPRKLSLLAVAVFGVILFKHWGNIRRLASGAERKFGEKAQP